MALNQSQKAEVVAELAQVAKGALSLVAAEYAGLTVGQLTDLRKKARASGVYVKVAKNTLVARAVEGTDYQCVADALTGPLLYAFSKEDPGAAGRLAKEFAKANDAAHKGNVSAFITHWILARELDTTADELFEAYGLPICSAD